MSVPVKNRKPTTMKFLDLSSQLYLYTTRVTSVKVKRRKDKSGKYIDASQTILPLRYSQTIGRELFEKASKIRDYIIMANEIKVISQINFNKRYEYQEEAKRLIVSMMDKIDQSFILINYNANRRSK